MDQAKGIIRRNLTISGAVQGVGFRPFVYRLANDLGLSGWVCNTSQGVVIEAEGDVSAVEEFEVRLTTEAPEHAILRSLRSQNIPVTGESGFEIRPSEGGLPTTLILPDLATCPDCLAEILQPSNRRYRYPFTNCTHCGPRFSIVEKLPYDRPNTTMKHFALCPECQTEYEDPTDRRFHAQPTACPVCGPHVELWDGSGACLATHDDALLMAAERIAQGEILALKGIGGFQLLVDARNDQAVRELRLRKRREEKPLAVMVTNLEMAHSLVCLPAEGERLLSSAASPILLLEREPVVKSDKRIRISEYVAPGNPRLGVMLPTTPLHHLLMRELGFPVVATSGNLSDEPICTDEVEALQRLGGIANFFLVHNRPIARHVDDSVVQWVAEGPQVLRRARGYAPLPVPVPEVERPLLAVGALLKNSVSLAVGRNAFISQHIGDLENEPALDAFREVIGHFQQLYGSSECDLIHDLHPDYLSTLYATAQPGEKQGIQHHLAHVLACAGENGIAAPYLGISWDGTGYGIDGLIWGGECILVESGRWKRAASLRTFPLPGGDKAVREPRRSALGLLYEVFGEDAFEHAQLKGWSRNHDLNELRLIKRAMAAGVNTPRCSSMGRLFDAFASLAGLRQVISFEGQAAMELEWCMEKGSSDGAWTTVLRRPENQPHAPEWLLDWEPMLHCLLSDLAAGMPLPTIARMFHNTLAEAVVQVAKKADVEDILLTGGCFQNRFLTERTIALLTQAGHRPHIHRHVPPNDGGVSFGQIMAAIEQLEGD